MEIYEGHPRGRGHRRKSLSDKMLEELRIPKAVFMSSLFEAMSDETLKRVGEATRDLPTNILFVIELRRRNQKSNT